MIKKVTVPDDCMPMCSSCCFYVPVKESEGGECRRYPPIPIVENDTCTFAFAVCIDTDWCGEYQRRVN